MKVIEEKKDRFGRYCLWFYSYNLKDIYEWLFTHYSGYKFAIVLDVMSDEYEPLDKPLPVYFLDEISEEVKAYEG